MRGHFARLRREPGDAILSHLLAAHDEDGKLNEDGKRMPLDVQAGDRILFGKYSGSEVRVADDDYVIMREEDVLAILK